jgi:hypothetical protein
MSRSAELSIFDDESEQAASDMSTTTAAAKPALTPQYDVSQAEPVPISSLRAPSNEQTTSRRRKPAIEDTHDRRCWASLEDSRHHLVALGLGGNHPASIRNEGHRRCGPFLKCDTPARRAKVCPRVN